MIIPISLISTQRIFPFTALLLLNTAYALPVQVFLHAVGYTADICSLTFPNEVAHFHCETKLAFQTFNTNLSYKEEARFTDTVCVSPNLPWNTDEYYFTPNGDNTDVAHVDFFGTIFNISFTKDPILDSSTYKFCKMRCHFALNSYKKAQHNREGG